MEKFLVILMFLTISGAVGALVVGLFYMAKGKKVDAHKSNKMMWRRIWFQAVSLGILVLILMLSKGD